MAKLLCAKSGTYFNCEHMPIAFQSAALTHPLFAVPQKKLLALAGQWAAGKLTKTESYLLFLSLLDSTSLVVWHEHVLYTKETDAIVANNMETLIHMIGRIECIKHPNFTLPSFSITRDTASLSNVEHWIEVWKQNYADWYNSVEDSRKADEIKDKIKMREEALQRLIKSSTPPETYATLLADWAAVAGAFPTFDTQHPITKTPTTLSEYWKQIIKCVANEDKLWRFPRKDIVELIEHCEDNIAHGNIYSHTLFKYLRTGLAKYDNYLGFGETELPTASASFTILPSTATVLQINRAALLSTAPETEPLKSQYPTSFAWLKAYTKWKLSQHKRD